MYKEISELERRLGRGLGSLLGTEAEGIEEGMAGEGPASLALDQIRPNRHQPRKAFDPASLEELRDSVQTHGILQPIVVRQTPLGYELIAGERRWRAARLAGLKAIPAIVREGVSDGEMLELALVENVQRRDLNALEKARGYQQLLEQLGLTQEEVAARVGLKRATVTNHLRLLGLPIVAQEALTKGLVSMGHARALLGVREEASQTDLLGRIIREGLSVRQTEEAVQGIELAENERAAGSSEEVEGADQAATSEPQQEAPWVRELQRRMQIHLGTKVRLANGPGYSGSIVIEYYSREDLDRLVEQLAPRDGL
jgi:ParB family transcriptional regulator, chromosome partitioning protein